MDAYSWIARYADHDVVEADAGSFLDLERDGLLGVELVPEHSAFAPLILVLQDGQAPVFFRRRKKVLDPNTEEIVESTTTVLGWKRGDSAAYTAVYPDGSILLTDRQELIG